MVMNSPLFTQTQQKSSWVRQVSVVFQTLISRSGELQQ